MNRETVVLTSTGFVERTPGELNKIPDYDPRSGNHFWIMIISYKVDPTKFNESTLFDHESLVNVAGPVCFYCEEAYRKGMEHRRCKGE